MATFTSNSTGDLSYPSGFDLSGKITGFTDLLADAATWADNVEGLIIPGSIVASPTQKSANLQGGGTVAYSGTGFGTSQMIINTMTITAPDGMKYVYKGAFYETQGTIDSLRITNSQGEYIEVKGAIEPGPEGNATLTKITFHFSQGDVVLNGSFDFDRATGGTSGFPTSIRMSDVNGRWQQVAEISNDVELSDIAGYADASELVQYLMSGNDVVAGDAQANNIQGFSGNDSLSGLAGDDTLIGGAGVDTLIGGAGNDTYVVDLAADAITEAAAGGGADMVQSYAASYALADNVEKLQLMGAAAIDGTGNALGNTLTGNSAANVLDGAGGNDTLAGGGSNDSLKGGDGTDTLKGEAGNDSLEGGSGDDVMFGGAGDDCYQVGSSGDKIYESTDAAGTTDAGGIDTVASSVSWTLDKFVENLTLTNAAANGTGNGLANAITGNDVANVLSGGGGNDTLTGGAGNDTFYGGVGNDVLNGEAGSDTARYAGAYSSYVVTRLSDGSFQVSGPEGQDMLMNVEKLQFDDAVAEAKLVVGGQTEFVVNTYKTLNQVESSVTALADGGWVMTWTSYDQDGSHNGIYGQRYNEAGFKVDAEFRVNTYTTDAQERSSVTALAGGGWVVTWTSVDQNGSVYDIYSQRFDAAGEAVDSEFRVNATTANNQVESSVKALADGGWVVTWASLDQDGSGWGIYGRRYAADGTHGDEFLVNTTTTGQQLFPAVDSFNEGGFVVVWRSARGGMYDVCGQRYDAEGSKVGTEFTVNTFADNIGQLVPSVTVLADGGFVVAWDSYDQDGVGLGWSIYGQRYDDAGAKVGDEFKINTFGLPDARSDQRGPSVTALSDGGWLVTWQSDGQEGAGLKNGIYGQRYDADGDAVGAEFHVNTYAVDEQIDPFVTALPDGGWIVTWTSYAQDGSEFSVVGKRFNANGEEVSAASTIEITGNNTTQTLNGTSQGDIIKGLAGNDIIDGGSGNDSMDGGAGDDTYVVDTSGDVVSESSDEGTDLVKVAVAGAMTYNLALNVENATITSTAAIGLNGNELDNVLTGNAAANTLNGDEGNDMLKGGAGNDVLDGGAGRDIMYGGAGDDTYHVDNAGDEVHEQISAGNAADAGGTDTVQSSVSWTLGDFVENLVLTDSAANGSGNALANTITGNGVDNTLSGNDGNDTLYGMGGNDMLKGGNGNDVLDGGTGSDVMFGGVGNDVYHVDSADDEVREWVSLTSTKDAGGVDTIISSSSQNLNDFAFIENLILTGSENRTGTGTDKNNVLTGNGGANTLDGKAGNDTLDGGEGADTTYGGAGNDVFYVDSSDDRAYEYVSASDLADAGGNDKVFSSASFTLSDYVETLQLMGAAAIDGTGNGLDNTMTGNSADNVLSGAGGNDTLMGGDGNDTLNGDAGDDILKGQAGNDTLDGGAGKNALFGGAGNDTYVVDSADDKVYESTDASGATDAAGTDTIESSTNWKLGAYVENLTLTGAATDGTGNGLANVITGNGSDNLLDGGAGNDTLYGGAGNDSLKGGAGNDIMDGGAGTDMVVYTGLSSAYKVVTTATGKLQVTGPQGTDMLTGVETLKFDDVTIGVTPSATSGNEQKVNTHTNNVQDNSSVVALNDGGWMVVWESTGQDGGSVGIYGQRYTADGAMTGAEFRINTTTAGAQSAPSVTALENGGWLVSWTSDGQDGSETGIYCQRYDAAGVKVGVEFRANTNKTQSQGASSVTALADGGWVVTWQSELQEGAGGDGIYGQRYDAMGKKVGVEFHVNTTTANQQHAPSVTALADGGWVVTWESDVDNTLAGYDFDILGQQFNSLGNAVGGEFHVNTVTANWQDASTVTALSGGGWVVTWVSNLQEGAGLGKGIYGRQYASNGEAVGAEFQVNTYETSDQTSPVVAALSGGGWVVIWTSNGQEGTGLGKGIYGQQYASNGTAVGAEFQINTCETGDQINPSVTGLPNGGWVVTWTSVGQDGSLGGIYSQHYGADGVATPAVVLTMTGTDDAQTLTGSFGPDTINGMGGNDILNGMGGDDVMYGGAGNDTYYVDSSTDGAFEKISAENTADAGGIDKVIASVSFTLSAYIEKLQLSGSAAINGTGNASANTLIGNGAANMLDGAGGKDTLMGGAGSDTYFVDSTDDTVVESTDAAGTTDAGGTDTVYSNAASYTLSSFVENLTLIGSAPINSVGNALDNTIIGNSGANDLSGGGGDDTIQGGGGNDTIRGGANSGTSQYSENLYGGAGDDSIVGGAGVDYLWGQEGNDILTGGVDAPDAFMFSVALNAATNIDTITDFTRNVDKIFLFKTNFAKLAVAPNAPSNTPFLNPDMFVKGSGVTASDGNDYILYDTSTGALYYDADGSGAGERIQFAILSGAPNISATDIWVI